MSPTLWFVVPVHGRIPLASICLRQLRRTCDELAAHGIEASAVVVADKRNLRHLRSHAGELGFASVERNNAFLSRKFNDGIQLALDSAYNPRPADYVVPIGSDDFVDWRLFLTLPSRNRVIGFQRISFVREDGREMTSRFLRYEGGCGIRIYPRALMEPLGYRPADEDRKRACDTSILTNLKRIHGDSLKVIHAASDARQIVDWKTAGQQLNAYEELRIHRSEATSDPFEALAEIFPAEALDEMRVHYELGLVAA